MWLPVNLTSPAGQSAGRPVLIEQWIGHPIAIVARGFVPETGKRVSRSCGFP